MHFLSGPKLTILAVIAGCISYVFVQSVTSAPAASSMKRIKPLAEAGGTCNDCNEKFVPGGLRSFPTSLRRYVANVPTIDQNYTTLLAMNDFNLTGTVTEDAFTVDVSNGPRALTAYKASGHFLYEDKSKLWNPSYAGPLLNQTQAISTATSFLQSRGLLPSAAFVEYAIPKEVNLGDGSSVLNHWEVMFGFRIDALAGLGPSLLVPVEGSAIRVQIGNAEIIGVSWDWRNLIPDFGSGGVLVAFDFNAAFALANQSPGFSGFCPTTTTTIHYTSNSDTRSQLYVLPSYYFLAGSQEHGEGVVVPATTGSPRVRIISPLDGSVFSACGAIAFTATVTGGTPPYSYDWSDPVNIARQAKSGNQNPTDQIGTTNPMAANFEGGNHIVRLTVTDANGLISESSVMVQVSPGTCEAATCPALGFSRLSNRGGKRLSAQTACSSCPEPGSPLLATDVTYLGWSLHAQITPDDGLELRNVHFKGPLLASDKQLPYYYFESGLMPFQACELKYPTAGNAAGNCVSHLRDPGIEVERKVNYLRVSACYCVDHLPTGSHSGEMEFCQQFLFWAEGRGCGGGVIGGDFASCAPYGPQAYYWYVPPLTAGNEFQQIEIYQRFNFDLPIYDRAAFFQDADNPVAAVAENGAILSPDEETVELVASNGSPGNKDNYHQREGSGPVFVPGCVRAELPIIGTAPGSHVLTGLAGGGYLCSHVHWRWGAFLFFHGSGAVIPASSQRVWAYALRWNVLEHIDKDPMNFDITNLMTPPQIIGQFPKDLVMWNVTRDETPSDIVSMNDWFFR